MLTIDGSHGEGGGQILRSALSSSLITGRAFRLERIRAGRRRPGLLHQHLTALRAATAISGSEVVGAALGSSEVTFRPGSVTPGRYLFQVGTAGSATLVLQTVLIPLLEADGSSEVVVEGGTHNESAPTFDFLDQAFTPLLRRMGADLDLILERPGFAPAGGGRIRARIGSVRWTPLAFLERGPLLHAEARAVVSRLPISIATRELRVIRDELGWKEDQLLAETVDAAGPGNVLALILESRHVTEVFTGFGRRGRPAESVAGNTARDVRRYLATDVPVAGYLADQLLLPLARAGGAYLTFEPTPHFQTNHFVLGRFLDLRVDLSPAPEGITVECPPGR